MFFKYLFGWVSSMVKKKKNVGDRIDRKISLFKLAALAVQMSVAVSGISESRYWTVHGD